jgi:hypothetical protein
MGEGIRNQIGERTLRVFYLFVFDGFYSQF